MGNEQEGGGEEEAEGELEEERRENNRAADSLHCKQILSVLQQNDLMNQFAYVYKVCEADWYGVGCFVDILEGIWIDERRH